MFAHDLARPLPRPAGRRGPWLVLLALLAVALTVPRPAAAGLGSLRRAVGGVARNAGRALARWGRGRPTPEDARARERFLAFPGGTSTSTETRDPRFAHIAPIAFPVPTTITVRARSLRGLSRGLIPMTVTITQHYEGSPHEQRFDRLLPNNARAVEGLVNDLFAGRLVPTEVAGRVVLRQGR